MGLFVRTGGGRSRTKWAAAACGLTLMCAGCTGGSTVLVNADTPPPKLPASARHEAKRQVAEPVRVRIPRIGVNAPVDPLRVTAKGKLPPPESNTRTGWWLGGPEPGEQGPAVIAGHVDSYRGPAVFFRLTDLNSGDKVYVDRADGSTVVFAVRRIEQHPKKDFPTKEVYGDTARSTLRLITCGGTFNERKGSYRSNIIVFATRVR